MTVTDTHAHLQDPRLFNDIDGVLDRAIKASVHKIVVVAYDEESVETAREIAANREGIFFTAGCHPHYAEKFFLKTPFWMSDEKFLNSEKLLAIGEIGLDLYYGFARINDQIEAFERQIQCAVSANLPVVVHSRNAIEKTLEVLANYPSVRAVLHSFEGDKEQARECVDRGYFLSFNGILTFKKADRKDVLKYVGTENVVLETDCPYLSPEPHRGKTNEPSRIRDVLKFASLLLDRDEEETAFKIEENAKKLFSKMKGK
ncbi:TatD family hydrolase [candidate division WOR-3 bacterium]|nr:TatD family hydrolase [candidate division WOR-3 bacterium]